MKPTDQLPRFLGVALTVVIGLLSFVGTSSAKTIIVGNSAGVPAQISTYDSSTGLLIASFTPDHSFNGRGVEVIGNTVFYTTSGELGFNDIYLAPFNGGLGGNDIGFFPNPRPAFGIQDLDYSNGILYALTGYSSGSPIVYALDPSDGHVIGAPIAINGPSTGADGFTGLPNGDFLINDSDASGIYRGYDPISGNPTGLMIDVPGDCCGVRYNAIENLLYYSGGSRTALDGTIILPVTFLQAGFEDITVLNVPEPSSLALAAIGLGGLGFSRRKH